MGLRFRKSVSLFPGVKLNFGTTGMSVSTGVPGFRKTYHTSGRVTTSVGIPGTGLYYVDTQNPNRESSMRNTATPSSQQYSCNNNIYCSDNESSTHYDEEPVLNEVIEESVRNIVQLDFTALKSIHKTSDDSIDWTEVLISPIPPDNTYNKEMWNYYHSIAPKILSGDIDSYLQLIYEVNPLDDLLQYGGNYEFGTDNPQKIEVEFSIDDNALLTAKSTLSVINYNILLQDFVCSVCIRIARDMFALLPVTHTIVHAILNGETVVSVDFDRINLSKVKYGYIDPSDTLSLFKHNMSFAETKGFEPVLNIR